MATKGKALTFEDRKTIEKALKEGVPVSDIAKAISFHRATVFREINRGGGSRDVYSAETAQAEVKNRRRNNSRSGRKPKKDIVQKWQADHPYGEPSGCVRETGLGKTTVYRWWQRKS